MVVGIRMMMVVMMVMIVIMSVVMVMVAAVAAAVMVIVMMRFQRGWRIMAVNGGPGQPVLLAELFVATGCIAITLAGTVFQTAANAFHMVVVAFLRQTDLVFKTQNLFAEFAHLAIHHVQPGIDLVHPVLKGRQHQFMVVEV